MINFIEMRVLIFFHYFLLDEKVLGYMNIQCDVFAGLTILYHLVSFSLFYDKLFKRYELEKVKYYEILKNISAMLKTHAGG